MDPVSLMLGVGGLALQAYGASQKSQGSSKANEAQQRQVELEQKADNVRRQFMETDARRKQMEVMRNSQRARGLALNNATTQGAGQGSGLQGGYGQISGETGTNLLGISQSLLSGRSMFDINAQISQQKIIQLQGQQEMSEGQGYGELGKGLIGSMGMMHQLTGGGNKTKSGGTSSWSGGGSWW